MSYPYDINPWDDNYNVDQQHQQPHQQGGYSDGGYINPLNQYDGQQQYNQYQQPPLQQQQQYIDDRGQSQQPEQTSQQQQQQAPSAFKRFLRQHVPVCGAIMDTLSGINLPFIDALVQHVNRDLLVSKMFYFFFYSAFGSLFPLMGVYFKQLGMNPAQVGILTGVRPFIEIFSAPFWHSLAERFHKSKALLLFSVLSWIVFTYSLAHIRPPASACVAFNDTDYVLYIPYSSDDLSNYEVSQTSGEGGQGSEFGRQPDSENEMFLDKMPAGTDSKEGKEKILASEENQNDQRRKRRRRRRRQVAENEGVENNDRQFSRGEPERKNKYSYKVDGAQDSGYESHLDLDVDLENDFDDLLIKDSQKKSPPMPFSPRHSYGSTSFEPGDGDGEQGNAAAVEYDEMEQSYLQGSRYKRGAKDDMLGESDEPEQEEQVSREEEDRINKERMGRQRGESGNNEEQEGEQETGEQEEQQQQAEVDGKKDHETAGKSGQDAGGKTTVVEKTTNEADEENRNDLAPFKAGAAIDSANKAKRIYKQRHKTPPTHIVGMSPITVEYAVNYKKEKHSNFVTPMFSTIVYKLDDIKEVFFLLLLLVSLGEFFSAPALTLADSATLSYLGENTDLYGRQRMFGSFSWAITLLLVGMALDNATAIADHPCGPHQRERSYNVCFVIFSLLMACAFFTATQFRFNYPKGSSSWAAGQTLVTSTTDSNTVVTKTVDGSMAATGNIDELYASTQPRSIFNTAPPANAPPPNSQQGAKEKFEFLDKWKSAVFAQRTWELPQWVGVFRQFRNSLHLTYLFITWFLGCGVGLVFTFLFWHLQDVGGTPTLFGICSVINHISEILAYFFSFSFIKRFGHTRVLSVGLGCNVIRFLYMAFLTNPYYALPFELVQGITHAACFAACCSYISHVSKPELRTSTQGVMQGLHHGIGRACGALLGGYMINAIGSRASFCIYGLLSGCVLAGFLYVRRKASQLEEEEVKVDDSEALGGYGAPQGVPSASIT